MIHRVFLMWSSNATFQSLDIIFIILLLSCRTQYHQTMKQKILTSRIVRNYIIRFEDEKGQINWT